MINVFPISSEHPAGLEITNGQVQEIVLNSFFFPFFFQQTENATRHSRGEPPLPDEDLSKIFKPLQSPSRLDYLLLSQQVNTYSKQVNQFSTHSFGKLFLAQALQENEK